MAYPVYPSNIVYGIPSGVPTIVPQTTAFALPAGPMILQATVALELSIDNTTFTAVTATTTGTVTGAAYARCTTSTCTVLAKVYK